MKVILLMGLTLLLASCQTMPYQPYAREVKKKPAEGGLIALRTEHRPEDRARADELMAANCGKKQPTVKEEGEVVVGQKTDATTSTKQGYDQGDSGFKLGGIRFGGEEAGATESGSTSATTTQLKEWQIAYDCTKTKK